MDLVFIYFLFLLFLLFFILDLDEECDVISYITSVVGLSHVTQSCDTEKVVKGSEIDNTI